MRNYDFLSRPIVLYRSVPKHNDKLQEIQVWRGQLQECASCHTLLCAFEVNVVYSLVLENQGYARLENMQEAPNALRHASKGETFIDIFPGEDSPGGANPTVDKKLQTEDVSK